MYKHTVQFVSKGCMAFTAHIESNIPGCRHSLEIYTLPTHRRMQGTDVASMPPGSCWRISNIKKHASRTEGVDHTKKTQRTRLPARSQVKSDPLITSVESNGR